MFKKKFHYFKRDKVGIGCEIVCPVVFLLMPILLSYLRTDIRMPAIVLD